MVKLTGGALVEFGSALDALSAAIEFQQAMAEVNEPADIGLVFRMGLHLGDLIVDGDPTAAEVPLARPDKPSIAVLPFQNLSGDPECAQTADHQQTWMLTTVTSEG